MMAPQATLCSYKSSFMPQPRSMMSKTSMPSSLPDHMIIMELLELNAMPDPAPFEPKMKTPPMRESIAMP